MCLLTNFFTKSAVSIAYESIKDQQPDRNKLPNQAHEQNKQPKTERNKTRAR